MSTECEVGVSQFAETVLPACGFQLQQLLATSDLDLNAAAGALEVAQVVPPQLEPEAQSIAAPTSCVDGYDSDSEFQELEDTPPVAVEPFHRQVGPLQVVVDLNR